MKVVSLQSKLIKTSVASSVIAGTLALLLFIIISIYQTMQIQDEIMDEISDMLLIADLTTASGQQIDELSEQFEIQYRLSNPQYTLTQSEDFKLDQTYYRLGTGDENYGFIWQDHQLWRSYTATDKQSNIQVLLIQPLGERFKELLHNFLWYSFILIMVWFIQWLILHFLIKRQFRIIHQLSTEISEKNVDDLSPIQTREIELKELQPMLKQLNHLLERLDQSLQAEQRFTADASHELRSPLSAIQLRLQLLQRKYPERAHDFVQMQQDVSRGIQTLENLLLLARLDPEKPENLPKSSFDIQETIDEVIQALTFFANEKSIKFIQKSRVENCMIVANQQLIFTCIRNILDNAIRYTPIGGNVYLTVEQQPEFVELTFENEGQAISSEVLERLGERFYRALGTKTQGSGLGLSICKKIIDLHHGKILFMHSEHGGLEVVIRLMR